jgi:hypothetical protein
VYSKPDKGLDEDARRLDAGGRDSPFACMQEIIAANLVKTQPLTVAEVADSGKYHRYSEPVRSFNYLGVAH